MIKTTMAYLYPSADQTSDYRLEQRGEETVIAYWNADTLGPQPSQEALAAAALPAMREKANALRRDRRTQAELAGFSHQGHPLDSDRDSILRIANAAASALSAILTQQPWATSWRCADETDLPLDAPGMLALQGALAMHGQVCHSASQAISADIEAAETVAQIEALIAALPTDPRWPA